MLGKKKKETADLASSLGPNLSFLDVVQDACRKGGRYTLTADSNGLSYVVLVDRGGPFNVSGGGATGSAALAMAAAVRSGSYTVVEGWPVDQPLYQLGLDATLQNLLLGSPRPEAPDLPPARGVDSLRNAAWSPDPGGAVATAIVSPPPAPPAPSAPPTAIPPLALPEMMPASGFAPTAAPPPAPAPAPVAPPLAAATPARIGTVEGPAIAAGREMGFGDNIELDAAMPGEAGASEKQGQLRHLVTQALLWTVQIEEPGRYTLRQSWILVLRALRSAFSVFIDPIDREVGRRWSRAKDDWRKSGESVAKQKRSKKTKPAPPE
jgi:hypothetical protein